MSKKLINDPANAVDEALAGLVAASPGLKLLEGHRVVVRADVQDVVKQEKVTILSGGGSGHEPAHAGYVGQGMLTAAVAGAVFASPPPGSILAALRALCSPAGTLMIVKNYTGDRLNFGIALERAKSEGMRVEMVIVGEDCALPSQGKTAGRRGLCGTILVHKIAGAMAEKNCSLNEIVATAEEVITSIGTMSVSLSPCSVPGHKPSFTLKEDEMELGLGIHGEAGAERTKIQPANVVIERMINQIMSQEEGYQYFTAEAGASVALVVNNLGGTSNLELLIMANAAIRYLVDKLRISVDRVLCGSLMTSLEMAGVSLTFLKMKPGWDSLIDLLNTAPGWPCVSADSNGSCFRIDSAPIPNSINKEVLNGKEPVTSLGKNKCIKEFMYNGDDSHFIWDTFGFGLHIPKDASPPGVTRIKVSIGAANSCEHSLLPANTELVSGVYSISASHAFTKPVTIEIEHVCILESHDQAENGLVFGHCSKHEPPYHFQIMKNGVFEAYNNFGRITLQQFLIYAILRYLMSYVTPITTRYCAGLYYSKDKMNCHCWYVYLVITKDAGIIKQEVRNYFVEQNIEILPNSPNQLITFNGDRIYLDIPRNGPPGWTFITLTTPSQILKSDVDSYVDGVIPHCQLYLSHPGGPPTKAFQFDLPLTGTDIPSIRLHINCMQAAEQIVNPVPGYLGAENLTPATVLGILMPVAKEWKNIGTLLNISEGELGTIEANYSRAQDCLREMINTWLRMSDPVSSWERLQSAVNKACGDRTAQMIFTQYN